MVNIVFGDSFDNFLYAMFYAFKNNIQNPIFLKAKKPSLFKTIVLDKKEDIDIDIKEDIVELFYDGYCFDDEKAYIDIYKSFLFYVKHHHLKDINQEYIKNLYYYRKGVNRERHKYSGFLRFHMINDFMYAKLEPKHFVIDYLGYFFKNRFPNERFIIHDVKRKKACFYEDKKLFIRDFDDDINTDADRYQHLWKTFFEVVSIKERENPKLQNHYAPKYFRKYMVEFS